MELVDNCGWEYAQYKDKWGGYFVTGPNGNIFIPIAGYYWDIDIELQCEGEWGIYWSGEHGSGVVQEFSYVMNMLKFQTTLLLSFIKASRGVCLVFCIGSEP